MRDLWSGRFSTFRSRRSSWQAGPAASEPTADTRRVKAVGLLADSLA
jgi:hypothetical protein